jgi:hypothetical protein
VSNKGWSSVGLPTVGDDPYLWTVADAAKLLGPPVLSERRVRDLIRLIGLEPVGKRRVSPLGQSGRHARVYECGRLIEAYDRLAGLTEA